VRPASGGKRIGRRGLAAAVRRAQHSSGLLVIGYFLAHRYDGVRALGTCRAAAGLNPLIWIGTANSASSSSIGHLQTC